MTTLIDASGAGIGGVSLILNEVVKNWPQNEPLILIGVVKGKEKDFVQFHHRDVQVFTVSKNRILGILQTLLLGLKVRSSVSSILLMSPTLTAVSYKKNTTVIIHDFMYIDKPEFVSRLNRLYRKISYRISIRKCQQIIFVSEATKHRFDSIWPAINRKSLIIVPVVNLVTILEKIEFLENEILAGKKLVVVPAHSRNKGYKFVEECRKHLDGRILLVFLTGSQSKEGTSLLKKSTNSVYLSWISDGQYSWLLHNSSCMVFLSEYEGFGIPVIEAKHVGLPLLISRDPALIETAKGYGVSIDPNRRLFVGEEINKLALGAKQIPVSPGKSWQETTRDLFKFVIDGR
jgi:glycosyltransferase involved in cell wall biosynthesis